jgi:SAM-dependent methyltransferase
LWPGALTAHLRSVGAEVAAIDPSPPFIDAIRMRFPDVDVRRGTAEELPYDTAAFDAALAQLVVHFMTDPVVGLRQMARVTRGGGVIAACVWDGPTGALAPFGMRFTRSTLKLRMKRYSPVRAWGT